MKKLIELILTKIFERYDYYSIKDYLETRLTIAHINTISNGKGKEINKLITRVYREMADKQIKKATNTVNEIECMTSSSFPELVKLNTCLRISKFKYNK